MRPKICKACGKEKPATTEFFFIQRQMKDGFCPRCKDCEKKRLREVYQKWGQSYREKNKEKFNERNRAYRERNKKRLLGSEKIYRKENKEKIKENQRRYYEKNRELILSRQKIRYYSDPKIKIKNRILARKYSRINRKKISSRRKLKYSQIKDDPEYQRKIKIWRQRFYERNSEKVKKSAQLRRRCLFDAMVPEFGPSELKQWIENQRKPLHCYLCGKKIPDEKFHIEHRLPISRGGKHVGYNLGISCPKCNFAKHDKTPSEFMPEKFRPKLPF